MKDIKEIVDNVINSLRVDILDYITGTEHCLFNWIANKEVQNFIKAYPEDYEYMYHLSVSTIGTSPLIKISFDEHPDDVNYIERYAVPSTFRDTTKARWMEWNGKVEDLHTSKKEKECTDLEQSEKLIGLGLDVSTADMGWNIFADNSTRLLPINDWDLVKDGWGNVEFIPAWSLNALIGILPEIKGGKPMIVLDDNWVNYPHINGLHTKSGNPNLIDAVYEMIIKLNELKML